MDLLLQPSWTWGAILSRHMEGNAVRAVENGFSLLRCSSQGESGVVGGLGGWGGVRCGGVAILPWRLL